MADAAGVRPLITFDLFSALIDSRSGGSRVLGALAATRGWPVSGERLYDDWDRRSKLLHQSVATWLPFAEHSRTALAATYGSLGLAGDPRADADSLLQSVGEWPLWPDVVAGLRQVAAGARIGVLSNVDDAVYARTAVARLGIDPADVLTSERLQQYKPSPRMYRRALEERPELGLHVASSARDVRGALESRLRTARLVRPGHTVDPTGPRPSVEVHSLAEVAALRPDSWQ